MGQEELSAYRIVVPVLFSKIEARQCYQFSSQSTGRCGQPKRRIVKTILLSDAVSDHDN